MTYTLGSAQTVKATVVGSAGAVVRNVTVGAKPAGTHTFTWDGITDDGSVAIDGSYQLRIETGDPARPGITGLATTSARVDRSAPTLTAVTGTGETFYPVIDRYRDTFTPSVTLDESARLTLTVKNSAGRTVRSISRPNVTGRQLLSWNGRTTTGALAPAGTYTYAFTATDVGGSTSSTATRQNVAVSHQRLVTATKVMTQKGTDSTGNTNANSPCISVTPIGSSYPNGMWLKNNCPKSNYQFAASSYRFTLPPATFYRTFTVSISGRSHSQPAEVMGGVINTQTNDYELTYPPKKVTTSAAQTLTLGTFTGPQYARGNRAAVTIAVPNKVYDPLTDWDLGTVTLKVTYQLLK